MNSTRNPSQSVAAGIGVPLLTLPWLNPFTYGPTPAVAQGLVVWLAAAAWLIAIEPSGKGFPVRTHSIAAAWVLAAVVSAAMGLLQYVGLAERFSPWVNFVEAGQAYANLRQRNQLAAMLCIGVAALLWWQAELSGNLLFRTPRLFANVLVGFAATLVVFADAATGSRTGMLQLLLLVVFAFIWRRGRRSMSWALIAYTAAAFLLPHLISVTPLHSGILGRMSEAAAPCSSRLTLWSNVLDLIAQKPWLGWGWGELRYAHFVTPYAGERFCEIMGNAHNLPLHLAVELGVPFAMLACGGLAWLVLRAKPWREQTATRQLAWSVLAVIGIHSLLEYPLWYGPFQLATVLAVWMLWQSRPGAAVMPATPVIARWPTAVAVCTLLACSYAAWDYWRISQIYLPVSQRAAAYREGTLTKIRASWLFADQVKFAELGIAPLTADNAEHIHTLAIDLLHFSPEASVVQKLIDSASLLGQTDEAEYFARRFQVAYPQDYATWFAAKSGARHKAP